MNKTVIGVPSGDHECFCFDVSAAEYIKFEDEIPSKYDMSCFNEDLFRIYGIPDVPIFNLNGKYHSPKVLLEVEYNDYGVVSIKETNIPVVEKQ